MANKKILVVDDEKDVLTVTVATLKRAGYSAITAENAEQAIEMAKNQKPDLIMLDICMPGMDGTQAGEIIKKTPQTKDIPIIYVTALLSKQEENDLKHKIGNNFFLAQPWVTEELLEEIKKRIG